MKRIIKYQLKWTGLTVLKLPSEYVLLDIRIFNGSICLWIIEDDNALGQDTVEFRVIEDVGRVEDNQRYVATAISNSNVKHIFLLDEDHGD